MASRLHNYLIQLHRSFADGEVQNAESAALLAGNITALCKNDLDNSEIVRAVSLLFNSQSGIVAFLQKTSSFNEFQECRNSLLDCLSWLLEFKVGTKQLPVATIQVHAKTTKDVLLILYNRDKSAKTKIVVISILVMLLRLFAGMSTGESLRPEQITERFFLELNNSKISKTVLQQIYILLGVIARLYPERVENFMERLLDIYLKQLKKQITSATQTPEFPIIAGCLFGLNELLASYPHSVNEHADDIYRYTAEVTRFNSEYKRYESVRAGFALFNSQASLFKENIYRDCESIYSSLEKWIEMRNGGPDVTNLAYTALDVFFRQVAEILCSKAESKCERPAAVSRFNAFMKRFSSAIVSGGCSRDVASSIKGYGYFATPCRVILNGNEVKAMFQITVPCCERIFFSESEFVEDKMRHLPSFIEALASIIDNMDDVSEVFLLSIENMVIRLIEYFPRSHPARHFTCYRSILKILFSLYGKGTLFKPFVAKIVYQGLLITCSHPVVVESVGRGSETDDLALISVDERDVKKISYKNYTELWRNILENVNVKEFNDLGVPLEDRHAVTGAVYDSIIISVLGILKKLDFTASRPSEAVVSENDDNIPTSDPAKGLVAAKPKDFQIFVNVVDFCRDLLSEKHVTLFEKWVYKFGYDVIWLSTKNPLVSGFYKLLAVCFKICSKLKYFQNFENLVDTEPSNEKLASYELFSKYILEVIARLHQYKEDLLISCLEAVLSLPTEMVSNQIEVIIPVVETTLKLGLSYQPLIKEGLSALEGWNRQLPKDALVKLYKQTLPLLNNYLMTASDASGETLQVMNLQAGRRSVRQTKKLSIKVVKKKAVDEETLTDVALIKSRIVKLLGLLGNEISHYLIDSDSEKVAKSAIAWDTRKHLKFDVPFVDMKPSIYLDTFLPHAVELASTSTNRQTKIAAAELLHSLVLFMLGTATTKSATIRQKEPMTKLFQRILPSLLKLACDLDQVVRQLFEPLVKQLIHWFSGNREYDGRDTEALLNALLDGVSNDTDSALRDFCAGCVKEFLEWSIKQTTIKEQKKNPFNIKALLKRLYHLSLHPSSSLRLGAALTFNRIYVVLREEESLVNTFTLELLVNFVESLAFSQRDDQHLGTIEQCKEALNHIERILIVKAALFNKINKDRRLPRDFEKGDLNEIVLWLLNQCGRVETECRQMCITLAFNLAPHIKGVPSANVFFQKLIDDRGVEFFVTLFEGEVEDGSSHNKLSLKQCPTLVASNGERFTSKAENWFQLLLAALDCYNWIFRTKLMDPSDVFTDESSSMLMKSVSYFLNDIVGKDIESVTNASGDEPSEVLTPRELDFYNRSKCTTIVRILDFVRVIIGGSTEFVKNFFGEMLDRSFWNLLVTCVLDPISLGFDMSNTEAMTNLPQQLTDLLNELSKNLSKDILNNLYQAVLKNIVEISSQNLFSELRDLQNANITWTSPLTHLISGYNCLHKANILLPALEMGIIDHDDYADKMLSIAYDLCVEKRGDEMYASDLEGGQLAIARKLLQLSFSFGVSFETVADHITNDETIHNAAGSSKLQRGIYFFVTFKAEISEYIAKCAPSSVECIMEYFEQDLPVLSSVVFALLDHLTSNHNLRKMYGTVVVDAVLANFGKLSNLWAAAAENEFKNMAFLILRKIFTIDCRVAKNVEHVAFPLVFDMYLKMLVDSKISLEFKGRLLDLLSFFTDLPEQQLIQLKKHLVIMTSNSFPLKSSELSKGSLELAEYRDVFKKFLNSLVISGSVLLLELIIELICTEPIHIYEDDIQLSLSMFIKRLSSEKRIVAVSTAYKLFVSEISDNVRQCALERVCITLLRHVDKVTVQNFFVANIKEIMNILQLKQLKVNMPKFQSQLMSKTCCFKLVELLYLRCTKEELSSLGSLVNLAFCDNSAKNGRELTQEVTKIAHAAKKENMSGETAFLEPRRLYHCAAYNAVVAVVMCTQTEIKFYTGFLFTENPTKGDFLWDNLVDQNKDYKFEIEFTNPLETKEKLVGFRREARREADGDEDSDDGYGSYPLSLHSLTNQNLSDSSLSEDVSQFDFTASPQMSSFNVDGKTVTKPISDHDMEVEEEEEVRSLEMDELNMHECMDQLCVLLQHVSGLSSTTMETSSEMPLWMKNICSKLSDRNTQKNVKLLIAKLIINNPDVFRSYAKHWLYPLMKLIVSGSCGSGINYFVIDILVVLLSWRLVAIPSDAIEQEMASELLKYLMENAYYERSAVVNHNLEVIKTLVECWKSCLEISTKVIYEYLTDRSKANKRNAIGIKLLGIVLACGLEPYTPIIGVNKTNFFQALAHNTGMQTTVKDVYANAAEVLGLALKHVAATEGNTETFLDTIAQEQLRKLDKVNVDRFLTCLYRIQKNYSSIANCFLPRVLFLLPGQHGVFQTYCLEIVLMQVDNVDDVYVEMKRAGLQEMLRQGNDTVKFLWLQVLNKMLQKLTTVQILEMLPSITSFVDHPKANCRHAMYESLFWIYDNFDDDVSDDGASIKSTCRNVLLRGLSEKDETLRLLVLNFWGHETRLKSQTLKRTVAILSDLYSPGSEQNFLSYATYLLLEMTYKSPDYNRKLFEHPLSDCKFEEYRVNTSWRARHSSMMPLFVDSLSSQPSSTEGGDEPVLDGQLRATQEQHDFTATQDMIKVKPFNWLTQSTLDTTLSLNFDPNMPSTSFSTSLFTVGSSPKKSSGSTRVYKPVFSNFGRTILRASNSRTVSSNSDEEVRDVTLLKRRIFKESDSMKAKYAATKAKQQQRHEQQRREQRIARQAKVTLYREYRSGDLPDIQILYKSIIAPLQALAQADDTVAKTLFTSLFLSILFEAKRSLSEDEYKDVMEQIGSSLNRIMSETKLYYPPVISVVQEVCYEHCDELKLDVDSLTSAALISLQQSTAILLLEKTIMLTSENTERKAKKARRTLNESPETQLLWFKLAELNKSQGNADISREIFAYKVGCHQLTREALEAETRGDFSSALQFYKRAYPLRNSLDIPDSEYDLWDDGLLQCYAELGNWDQLSTHAVNSFDYSDTPNLNRVWDELYYQDHYLPYIIRGKLRLIMHGKMDQSLNNFVDATLNDLEHPERKQLLESNHCEELAVLSIIQNSYIQARVYRSMCIERFLHDWKTMSNLALVHRRTRLCDLQKFVEMQQFLSVAELDRNQFENGASELVEKWDRNCPYTLGSVSCINDIVEYRCMYLKLFERQLEDVADDDDSQMETDDVVTVPLKRRIQQSKLSLLLRCAEAAACQNNFSLALQRLKESREFANKMQDGNHKLKWCHAYVKTHLQRSVTQEARNRTTALLSAWDQLKKYDDDECLGGSSSLFLDHRFLYSRTAEMLSSVLIESRDSVTQSQLAEISQNVKCEEPTDTDEILNSLLEFSFVKLNEGVVSLTADVSSNAAFAHLQLANFCDKHLRKAEDEDGGCDELPSSMSQFPKVVVENLLDAIRFGSDEAVQLFPRLFQIIEMFPNIVSVFQNKVKEVPCWMLIRWISQMVALLDKTFASAFHGLVVQIARQYPQALVYPFKVSSTGYSFDTASNCGKKNKAASEKIKAVLDRLWLVHEFVDALEELKHPLVDYKQYHIRMGFLLRKKEKEACKSTFQEMFRQIFVAPLQKTDSSVQPGKFRKLFANNYSKIVEQKFGKDGSKLLTMNCETYNKVQAAIFAEMKKQNLPLSLKDYCDWLCNFQSKSYSVELEIPGQYSGLRKPIPQYHTKVAKFDYKVQVLMSIQCPKAITIYGNDYKTYKFLVKGGEDLRLDQRIEQLFTVMNDIYNKDAATASRQLKLITYQVIPLTDRLGLLEWVENTAPLKEFLLDAFSEEEKKTFTIAHNSVFNWICGVNKFKSPDVRQVYDALYLHPKWDEVLQRYQSAVAAIPQQILKRAFVNLSTSLESFLTLRNHFIVSHSVLCISQYILGIGDRHLSNFMVSLDTGGMVGIDFGHAFGSATQLLPVPELMPFRLTPQLLNLMEPFREQGLFQATMIHALSALRKNPSILLNTMDIFIKEPSLDWKEVALKQMDQEMDDEVDVSWYPRQKVAFAKRKLNGHSSRKIMADELNLRTIKGKSHRRILEVCSGLKSGKHQTTASTSSDVLSVEQQVSTLLDHATDVNIMSTTYMGWSSFA